MIKIELLNKNNKSKDISLIKEKSLFLKLLRKIKILNNIMKILSLFVILIQKILILYYSKFYNILLEIN